MITVTNQHEIRCRCDAIMDVLPQFLASDIPEGMKDWPEPLILGLMLNVFEHTKDVKPEAVSRYIAGHMRVPFRPYGRKKLDALIERHLKELTP